MIRENLHTHTLYCDGENTAEEIILAAIDKSFSDIGFSSHSFMDFDKSYCMTETEKYRSEISALKEKYRGKIRVWLGLEKDYFSTDDNDAYDYVIGSVHSVLKNGQHFAVDESADVIKNAVENEYQGDYLLFIKDYYKEVSDLVRKTDCDIIGHFDLISKYFDVLGIKENEDYLSVAFTALEELIPYGKPFEINTGAIARGTKKLPYPTFKILKRINELGGKIIFSSDCHNKEYLDCYFKESLEMAKEAGFTKRSVITENGFIEIGLEDNL